MNGLCKYGEAEDQGILQKGNAGMMLYLEINLPTYTKLGESGVGTAESPEINPSRQLDFSQKKENPLVLKELVAKIKLEAYRVLALIKKRHLWCRWGQDSSGKKLRRKINL